MTSPTGNINLRIAELVKDARPEEIVEVLTDSSERSLLSAAGGNNNNHNNNNTKPK
ncbi:hypothetical protein [Parafrankia sp. EUN1f]|uniref:hypothetical protein n=1 Tax=Parafrankia sp. EUN1f TaxID=102897 RepID=UPI0001C45F03|nr:hypothetical protein [Parafrankia sp. EUN1f]EFC81779.1 hypothetical protein FrEUN1fDRAFT_5102 [Parafrankia sp. EUN1f]